MPSAGALALTLALLLPLLLPLLSASSALAAPTRGNKKARPTKRSPIVLARGCGRVPAQGCCNGGRLYYCRRGRLAALDCRGRPRCGWHKRGFYDCNTAGAIDPTGRYARACFFGKKSQPPARHRPPLPPAPSSCGYVTIEGCCTKDNTLRYCNDGRVLSVKCAINPACGWRGVAQLYNCGTVGDKEPRGVHPRSCAALKAKLDKAKARRGKRDASQRKRAPRKR